MVTVIQQAPGNAATDVLGALNAVLQGIQANRDKGQEQQLKLLEILAKQPGAKLESVAPDQLQQPNFLDYLVGAQPRTLAGAPAARFGGSALTVGRLPALGADPDVAALTRALTPPQGVSESRPIIQTPMPMSNVTVPQAPTPVPPPAVPTGGVDTGLGTRATAQGVDPATSLALKANEGSGQTAVSRKGAVGTFQMKPSTARKYLPPEFKDMSDVELTEALKDDKISEGLFLAHQKDLEQKFPGRPDLVAAAYFSGEGNVKDGKIVDPTLSDGNMTVQQYVDRFQRRYQMQAVRQAPPASEPGTTSPQAPPGPSITPPGAAAEKVAGPGAPAPSPQPSAAAPTSAQPVSADTDREAQLTQRRLDANPDARMVPVPGVGMRSQAWARDYLSRLRQYSAPNLYGTPDNVFKYNEAKRKAADDLDKDEVQLRKDVQVAVEKHPGQEALFTNVRSQSDLAGRVEQARSPGQLQTAATADLQSMLDRAPRDANGTYTPASLQAIARVQAYWGGYGVKHEAFKPQLDAAGVGAAEDAMKGRAQLPVKQAEEQQRLRTQQQEDPFKGDPMAQVIGNKMSADFGIPLSQFTDKMRQKVLDDAANQKALEVGKAQAAKSEAEAFDKMDVYTRTAALAIVREEGTPVSQINAEQIRRAQVQGDKDKAEEQRLRVEAERQGRLNAPVSDPALLGRYVDLQTGAKHPSQGESIPQMQAKGYVYLDKPQQDTLRNGVSSLRFVDRMHTMLLGGIDHDGSFNDKPGEWFPGIYQGKDDATSLAARAGRTFDVRKDQIYGRTLGQWADIYDRLKQGSLGHIGREMGGERGHFTDEDAKRAEGFFADVGVSGKRLATSKAEATKLFQQIRGFLNDRIASAVGMGRDDPLPWDPDAPTSQRARSEAMAMGHLQMAIAQAPRDAEGKLTPEGQKTLQDIQSYWLQYGARAAKLKPLLDAAAAPTPPQGGTPPAASTTPPQESEDDVYRRLTSQQPQRTP